MCDVFAYTLWFIKQFSYKGQFSIFFHLALLSLIKSGQSKKNKIYVKILPKYSQRNVDPMEQESSASLPLLARYPQLLAYLLVGSSFEVEYLFIVQYYNI